jgi:hypothetical protein
MFCGSCGAEVAKDNRFCSVCGQAVVDVDDSVISEVAESSDKKTNPDNISNVPAWILAFLSPVVLTIFTAIFRREMDNMVGVVLVLAVANLIIGYTDLKRIQKLGLSKPKTTLLTVAMLLCTPLYLILRATIISGFNLKRFVTSGVNVVLIIAFAVVAPIITRTTINDVLPEIEYSIVRRYSSEYDETYRVVSPLHLTNTGEYTYEGKIWLISDEGNDLNLTVEVLFNGDYWTWSAHS